MRLRYFAYLKLERSGMKNYAAVLRLYIYLHLIHDRFQCFKLEKSTWLTCRLE